MLQDLLLCLTLQLPPASQAPSLVVLPDPPPRPAASPCSRSPQPSCTVPSPASGELSLPRALPPSSTNSRGGSGAGTGGGLCFSLVFPLSFSFFNRHVSEKFWFHSKMKKKYSHFLIYPTAARPPHYQTLLPEWCVCCKRGNLRRQRVITQSLCCGHSWWCPFYGLRHMRNDVSIIRLSYRILLALPYNSFMFFLFHPSLPSNPWEQSIFLLSQRKVMAPHSSTVA